MSSFGEELRRERELREVTLAEISESTKISLRYLDALERNDFRHLPGGVFNKGFVRAFAQYIGVDPEAMVNAYLIELRQQETRRHEQRRKEAIRRHSPAGEEPRKGPPRAKRARWAVTVLVVVLLALVALLGFVMLRLWSWGEGDRELPSPGQPRSAATSPGPTDAPSPIERVRDGGPPGATA